MISEEHGPVGGRGGEVFLGYAIPKGSRLKEVRICTGEFVDSIQFVYADAEGNEKAMRKIGGKGGECTKLTLEEDEYLTAISGQHGWYVDSICLHTNKRQTKCFGGEYGHERYHLQVPDGCQISGLFGRAGWYLDAIGIIVSNCYTETGKVLKEPPLKDLEQIRGLGPHAAKILLQGGIRTLKDLADADVVRLEDDLRAAGGMLAHIDPASWPRQASMILGQRWDELKALQETLQSHHGE